MIITKETKKKIQTIVNKMEKIGFGSKEQLTTELNKRFIEKRIIEEGL